MSAAREWISHRAVKGEAAPTPRGMAQILKTEEIDPAQNEVDASGGLCLSQHVATQG
jgi:hypothetical protein